jgi:2-amino-4-hydroxy-6-hydroxymethyldihydropteridine diphosphokinase/dihydropteroate synthase
LSPEELLISIKQIEREVGRMERGVWAPREIDIDILYWEGEVRQSKELNIPHPGLRDRPFALLPATELIPSLGSMSSELCRWRAEAYYPLTEESVPSNTRIAPESVQSEFRAALCSLEPRIAFRPPRPEVVGIVNVTPDSFSDGGTLKGASGALERIQNLYAMGATVIDVGAESTRPGAVKPDCEEEVRRLSPVLELFRECYPIGKSDRPLLSIDTRHVDVVEAVSQYSPDWINDVSAGESVELLESVAQLGCRYVLMHHLGVPPSKEVTLSVAADCVNQVKAWFQSRVDRAVDRGIDCNAIILDPGIGFGKTSSQSFEILRRADEFHAFNLPLLIGHSRKSFLSQVTDVPFADRDIETTALGVSLLRSGISFLRVHDVEMAVRALRAAVCVA